jgi:hypothetical protein
MGTHLLGEVMGIDAKMDEEMSRWVDKTEVVGNHTITGRPRAFLFGELCLIGLTGKGWLQDRGIVGREAIAAQYERGLGSFCGYMTSGCKSRRGRFRRQ